MDARHLRRDAGPFRVDAADFRRAAKPLYMDAEDSRRDARPFCMHADAFRRAAKPFCTDAARRCGDAAGRSGACIPFVRAQTHPNVDIAERCRPRRGPPGPRTQTPRCRRRPGTGLVGGRAVANSGPVGHSAASALRHLALRHCAPNPVADAPGSLRCASVPSSRLRVPAAAGLRFVPAFPSAQCPVPSPQCPVPSAQCLPQSPVPSPVPSPQCLPAPLTPTQSSPAACSRCRRPRGSRPAPR